MSPPSGDSESRHNDLQRDLGRVEGKVDSLLTAMQNMLASMTRADADRDNLQRDLAELEKRHSRELTNLKTKIYWLGGATTAGGFGIGAGASKILSAIFLQH